MSISAEPKPFNRVRLRTCLNIGTRSFRTPVPCIPYLLFALAVTATLSIWSADPRTEWCLEFLVFLLAGWMILQHKDLSQRLPRLGVSLALVAIAAWGFVQLGFGATVYRYPTLNASLRFSAMAAVAMIAAVTFDLSTIQSRLLPAFAWFGFILSVVSVLAYYTSPNRIFWVLESPYPDVWGPFLSRNNFAQFLELCFPAALWLWLERPRAFAEDDSSAAPDARSRIPPTFYGFMACMMLAAGFGSASRAGASLLLLEAVVVVGLIIRRTRGHKPVVSLPAATGFLAAFLAIAILAGGDTLINRFREPDVWVFRAQIFESAVEMIDEKPLKGYGLGTFSVVYPEFARFDSGERVDHAHSDWLEWASEGGVAFAAGWALLLALLAPAALRSIWGVGVIAVFLHALVDYPFARLGVAVWVFFLAGAIERTCSRAVLPHRRMV